MIVFSHCHFSSGSEMSTEKWNIIFVPKLVSFLFTGFVSVHFKNYKVFESKSTVSSMCKCHAMKVYRVTCTFRIPVLYANCWSVHFKPLPYFKIWIHVISLERPRCRWEDNIKMDLQEVGGGGGDWVELAQDRNRWQALVNTVMNFRVR